MDLSVRWMSLPIVAGLAGACGGDLFHATDWSSVCDADPAAKVCPDAGPSGDGGQTTATTSSSTTSSAGGGGPGGGGGAGGAGGGGVGGAGGMCSTCQEAAEAFLSGGSDAPPTLCRGASQDAWDALTVCVCLDQCVQECIRTCQAMLQASPACQTCAFAGCNAEVQACQAN